MDWNELFTALLLFVQSFAEPCSAGANNAAQAAEMCGYVN